MIVQGFRCTLSEEGPGAGVEEEAMVGGGEGSTEYADPVTGNRKAEGLEAPVLYLQLFAKR